MNPTRAQIEHTLNRLIDLCQPTHREGTGPLAWDCNLQLALQRADDYAGVLRSSQGGTGSGGPSDPVAATVCTRPITRPDDTAPPPWNIDQILHEAIRAVVDDCWWLVTRSHAATPAVSPAATARALRRVLAVTGWPTNAYSGVLAHSQTVTNLIVDLCKTDRTEIGYRKPKAANCEACGRHVPGTPEDRLRQGLCDKCRTAFGRAAASTVTGLNRQTWAAEHLTAMTAPQPEPVRIDPKQPIPTPL